jgi:anti-anti-sigma regulatory factor
MSGAPMPTSPRVVLPEDLSVRSWRGCADRASLAVESARALLVVECAELRTFDEHGVAMLVGLAHYSARRQVRVVLSNPPARLRQHLELVGLAWFFEWQPLVDKRPSAGLDTGGERRLDESDVPDVIDPAGLVFEEHRDAATS